MIDEKRTSLSWLFFMGSVTPHIMEPGEPSPWPPHGTPSAP
jgi:hypothetical protein